MPNNNGGPSGLAQYSGLWARIVAGWVVAITLLFVINDYLIFWRGWPGALTLFEHHSWFGLEPLAKPLEGALITLGWFQLFSYLGSMLAVVAFVVVTPDQSLRIDGERLSRFVAYLIRASFWTVLLVGLADALISFLRVEGFLVQLVGEELAKNLGLSRYRGTYLHIPLIGISLIIAYFVRSLGFIWLALLVVIAEFQIVISRFIFSYEQAFMGDLVRFWYAALFLFASAYALVHDGHVRVDVLYAHFSDRGKALTNAWGSMLLGIPLCWTILSQGLWVEASSLNSPMLSFEISQSGYGMYVKYLMASFLVIFAVSMTLQFMSYFLESIAVLRGESTSDEGGEPILA